MRSKLTWMANMGCQVMLDQLVLIPRLSDQQQQRLLSMLATTHGKQQAEAVVMVSGPRHRCCLSNPREQKSSSTCLLFMKKHTLHLSIEKKILDQAKLNRVDLY